MIVVSLRRSMPRLLEQVRLGIPDDVLLDQIRFDTTCEWSGISQEAFEQYAQYLVGVHAGRIASAYKVTGYRAGEAPGRIRFDVTAAVELAGVIGEAVPGGPWKRGEARPVRYLDTGSFMRHFLEEGALDGGDGDGDPGEIDRRIVDFVRREAQGPGHASRSSVQVEDLLRAVEVTVEPRGGVRVTVPLGTRVTVVQREA